ncbi:MULTISPECIES: protein translocase subunit SecDF [unclassified Lysinibacillus]|uniref:protein translocase subunit SecDF n=1 Tax=unclassified Lysinibacillus TaxID=2636778 RepID=UPI00088A8166|nr:MULTISPECIES: protein translocase subunit SecDF [unclassified Lysinibacillus]SCZ10288.1 protein translocase subunit secF/protein translocase subunit secD [Lysinibacillus sp. SG9]SDB55288.1 protein translocase subunit secF/protein translocase subunit secD [Lysinibacillus sp. TC-37]SFT10414.1 protein translocase subunit secF/protein translocase subunit secD [Lysinibacillus sp. SG55]
MKLKSRIVAFLLILVLFVAGISTTVNGVLKDIKLGLDLQGGFEVLYEVNELKDGQKITPEIVTATATALGNRVNAIGVSEPSIQVEGENRIRVQLAGVEDQESARKLLSTSANLTFRDVDDNLLLDGDDLKENGASASFDQQNRPIVSLKLKDAKKFADITSKIAAKPAGQNLLVVWLDFEEGVDSYKAESQKAKPRYASAATVSQTLNTTDVMISGNFSVEETKNLSGILNAGALPVKLDEIYSTSVGAQFGDEALKSTIFAGIVGVVIIFLFMLFYYRLPGFISIITLGVFTFLVLVVFDWINAVLTLPGIAAIVLGIGMAVDANILAAERIREELRVGYSAKQAFQLGSKQSLSAIVDAQLTTLLAAGVLFFFGTSSVKGFATTLIISILLSFLTAVWGSRVLLGLLVNSGYFNNPAWYGIAKSKQHSLDENIGALDLSTKFDRFDFVHNRKKFYTFSLAILVAGLVVLGVFRLNLGIDFSSGTRIQIEADQTLTKEAVEKYVDSIGFPSEDIVLSGEKSTSAVVRYKTDLSQADILKFQKETTEEYGHKPTVSTVSPTVGKELVKNAIKALSLAALGIIIYVAIRFEWRMGIGAIVSLLHDVFLIVAVFSFMRLEVDITFIAAVLTIVGYSINDTIVTFDRMRENLDRYDTINDREVLANIVNKSLRQTMGRSVNTVLTVIIVVVSLLIFGAPSIQNFSIALLIGLITGMYSSICIAAQIWYSLKIREMKKSDGKLHKKEKKQWGTDEPTV